MVGLAPLQLAGKIGEIRAIAESVGYLETARVPR
jgi:hypothetical protein